MTTEAESEKDGTHRSSSPNSNKKVTYWRLLSENSNFRWFLLSYLVSVGGEWLSYVASIATIEQIQSSNGSISRTSISILVIIRLLPSSLFAPIGGTLADSYDRRKIMIILELTGALVIWVCSFILFGIHRGIIFSNTIADDSGCTILSLSFCHCTDDSTRRG